MRVWLVQRAESTPQDDNGDRRLMRIGILADILQSQGHEVVWWTSAFDHIGKKKRYQKSKRVKIKENYHIHYLKCYGYKKNISLARFIDNYLVANQFKKEMKLDTKKPDVILTSIPSIELSQIAVRYAVKNRVPVVLDIRDLYPDVFKELLPKSLSWFINLLTIPMRYSLVETCKKATAISGITDSFVNWAIKYSGRKRDKKDVYFPMAYLKRKISDKKKAESYLFWEKFGISKHDKVLNVLFLGSFSNSFEFNTIFLAAKILQIQNAPVRFIICGVGKKEPIIRKECDSLNNCVYAGWVNAAQIKTILELSDVGLAPYINSKNFVKNIPNKPAEYLSEGLLVATSLRYGKLCDIIKSKDCGLSYGSDSVMLALFLENLSKNKSELTRLVKNAEKAFVSEFDGYKVYLSMVKFLEKLALEKIK